MSDVRLSLRALAGTPGLTLAAAACLALGIGATSAIFSLVDAVLLKPLPYRDPDRLVAINQVSPFKATWLSYPDWADWRDEVTSFEGTAVYQERDFTLLLPHAPERVRGAVVSGEFTSVLGIRAAQGREFRRADENPGAHRVAVLSHSLWLRMGSRRGLVGDSVTLNDESYEVIGVMPPGFRFGEAELWTPLPPEALRRSRRDHFLSAMGRLRRGVTHEDAEAELSLMARRVSSEHGEPAILSYRVSPFHRQLVEEVRPALMVLSGAVGFVLFITCLNVANLQLARAAARESEMAVRVALGAGRGRLVKQLLTESLMLGALGGAGGLLLATWGTSFLRRLGSDYLPSHGEIALDARVIAFSVLATLATAILFGMAPALQAFRLNVQLLQSGARTVVGTRGSLRFRRLLVVTQVALALILLAGAGLTLKSYLRIVSVDPGFARVNVLTMWMRMPESRYSEPGQREAFSRLLLESLGRLPGVQAVGLGTGFPLGGGQRETGPLIEGRPFPRDLEDVTPSILQVVSPRFFNALGIPLLSGRFFEDADGGDSKPVVIVDSTLARRFWPGEEALGRRIAIEGTMERLVWREVVGVVGPVSHYGLQAAAKPQLYVPHLQMPEYFEQARPPTALVVRASADPTRLVSLVRGEISLLDPTLPVYDVKSMQEIVASSLSEPRQHVTILGAFGSLALALAVVGVAGVLTYSVSQRTREMGIRMALGAEPGQVTGLVVKEGMRLAFGGLLLGLAGAWGLTRLMSGILYQVSPRDPAIFLGVSSVVVLLAFLASYLPALRAARVDPTLALRQE